MTDQILRIGKGPQLPKQAPKTWPWVLAAAVLISVSALILVAFFVDPPQPEPTKDAALVVQCESIRHEYESWQDDRETLDGLPVQPELHGDYESGLLMDAGNAFFKSVGNYPDEPSKRLALAVANYNYELSGLRTYLVLGDTFDTAQYAKVQEAWGVVEAAYAQFDTDTCR